MKKDIEYEYCQRCGKRISLQEYRLLGYGPICYQRMLETRSKLKLFKPLTEYERKNKSNK